MKKLILQTFFTLIIVTCYSRNNEKLYFANKQEIDIKKDVSEFNLLFIGNSLTFVNDLPKLVESIALANGKDASVTTIANGNYALIDHWNDGIIQIYIESGDYDFVIVQQGPSSQPYGRELLFEYGTKISDLCKNNDAKLAYYMVWPSLTYYSTFDGVIFSYTEAANMNNDILCPVGEVWKSYFDETQDFSYYGSDGFHPSLAGSKVAAKIIYESLFPN
jgi:hypothetical protein